MSLRIATWNINSIRMRIGTVKQFVDQSQIDVLCLQETKAHNDVFPFDALRELGFPHIHAVGMKAYNGTAILSKVPITPIEVERLNKVQASHHWVDAVRHFIPPERLLYTWWSYRAQDWEAADKGRRLDHIWVTPSLQNELAAAEVERNARGWTLPSDHVPVIVTLK